MSMNGTYTHCSECDILYADSECPCCQKQEDLEEKEEEIDDLQEKVAELERELDELKDIALDATPITIVEEEDNG